MTCNLRHPMDLCQPVRDKETCHVAHINESWLSCEWVISFMFHIWMSHVTHASAAAFGFCRSFPIYERHVPRTNDYNKETWWAGVETQQKRTKNRTNFKHHIFIQVKRRCLLQHYWYNFPVLHILEYHFMEVTVLLLVQVETTKWVLLWHSNLSTNTPHVLRQEV